MLEVVWELNSVLKRSSAGGPSHLFLSSSPHLLMSLVLVYFDSTFLLSSLC